MSDNNLGLLSTLGRQDKECFSKLSPTILPSCQGMFDEDLSTDLQPEIWGYGPDVDRELPSNWISCKKFFCQYPPHQGPSQPTDAFR